MMLLETGMREEVSSCRQENLENLLPPMLAVDGVANRPLEHQEAKRKTISTWSYTYIVWLGLKKSLSSCCEYKPANSGAKQTAGPKPR